MNEKWTEEERKKKTNCYVIFFSTISRSPVQYGATTDDEKKIAFDVMTVLCERFECISTYTLARVIIPYFFLLFVLSAIFLWYFQLFVFYTNNSRAVFYTISVKYILNICILSFKREILLDFFITEVILLLFYYLDNKVTLATIRI